MFDGGLERLPESGLTIHKPKLRWFLKVVTPCCAIPVNDGGFIRKVPNEIVLSCIGILNDQTKAETIAGSEKFQT